METSTKWIIGGVGVAAVTAYLFWPKTATALPAGPPAWLPKGIPPAKQYPDFVTIPPVVLGPTETPVTITAWNLTKNVPQTFMNTAVALTISQKENDDLQAAGVSGTIFYANDGTGAVGRFYTPINL